MVVFVSLATNYVLGGLALKYYKQCARLHLDPARLSSQCSDQFTGVSKQDKTIVALIGDSRIAQWRDLPERSDCVFANLGIGGQTSKEVLVRLRQTEWTTKPEIAIVQVGINDLKYIGLFAYERKGIVETCRANLRDIVQLLAERNIHTVMLTMFPTGKCSIARSIIWPVDIDSVVREVNDSIKALAGPMVTVVDCDTLLRKGNGINPKYYKDTLHLNNEGYAQLNAHIGPVLSKLTNIVGSTK